MTATNKMKEMYDGLVAQQAELRAKRDPLQAERDALLQSIAPQLKKADDLAAKIKAINPELAEVDNMIGKLAIVLGGRAMSQGE
jgi:uncharacterized coiled-coil DUF342 family protein